MAAFFVLAGRKGATQGARGCLKIHLIQAYEVGAHGRAPLHKKPGSADF